MENITRHNVRLLALNCACGSRGKGHVRPEDAPLQGSGPRTPDLRERVQLSSPRSSSLRHMQAATGEGSARPQVPDLHCQAVCPKSPRAYPRFPGRVLDKAGMRFLVSATTTDTSATKAVVANVRNRHPNSWQPSLGLQVGHATHCHDMAVRCRNEMSPTLHAPHGRIAKKTITLRCTFRMQINKGSYL